MKTIDDLLEKLRNDHRQIEVCEVLERVMTTIALLDSESENFKGVAAKDKKGYIGMINSLTLSLITNLAIIGLDEDEAIDYVKDFNDEGLKGMSVFTLIKKGVFKA